MTSRFTVLLASPLADDLVEVVRSVDPDRLEVCAPRDLFPDTWDAAWPGWPTGSPPWSSAEWVRWRELFSAAEILYDTNWLPRPMALRMAAPRLQWVQATMSGVGPWAEKFELDGRHPVLTTAAGIHARPLAEFVLHSLLHFRREVGVRMEDRAAGVWRRDAIPELAGSTVLVVGLGHVGRRIAQTLASLGVHVWAVRRVARPARFTERVIERSDLSAVLPSVDAVVLCAPLTNETRGLIGADEIEALPSHAIVVNVARGGLIDEDALVVALGSGRLAGAALDVFAREPLPRESRLWTLSNVLFSPHNAGVSREEPRRAVGLFVANLKRYLAGRPLKNRYRGARGY